MKIFFQIVGVLKRIGFVLRSIHRIKINVGQDDYGGIKLLKRYVLMGFYVDEKDYNKTEKHNKLQLSLQLL